MDASNNANGTSAISRGIKVNAIAVLSHLAVLVVWTGTAFGQDLNDGPPTYSVETQGALVPNADRASRIVGMHVKNYQNQDLGRVQDVVFNLQSGKVAYVVLALPTGQGDKLLAVPPTALLPSAADPNRLVMNLDRGRLESLQGFSSSSWPDPNHPFVGSEALWGYSVAPPPPPTSPPAYSPPPPPPPEYQGTAPRYQVYTGTDQYQTLGERSSFRGRIIAVSPESRTMTVEGNNGEVRDFVFADRPNLQLKNTRYPRIVDLKVGFPVSVGYRQDPNGTCVAQTVIRTDTPEVK
jgi:hypothetical protein